MTKIRAGQLVFAAIAAALVFVIIRNLSDPYSRRRSPARHSTMPEIVMVVPPEPPLVTASRQGDLKLVRELISRGAGINSRMSPPTGTSIILHSYCPLESAIMFGHGEVARILLAHGANIKEYRNGSLLYDAIQHTPRIMPDLLKRRADPNDSGDWEANNEHRTNLNPLCAAIRTHDRALVTLLLQYGAKLDPAPPFSHPIATDAYVPAPGAPASPRTPTPMTLRTFVAPSSPLGVAVCYAPEFEPLLLIHGANLGADRGCILAGAAHANRPELFPRLLALGAKINGADEMGETALTYTAATTTGSVSTLLEHGADPNAVPRSGRSALTQAAISGNVDAVRLMLAHKAEVNQAARTGRTPLYFAVRHKHGDIAELLRKAGARE